MVFSAPVSRQSATVLTDTFGRRHDALRLSVTDRCNLRCQYCMPEDKPAFMPRARLLEINEYVWFVRVMASLGITRVRLTGGEPLLRKGIASLVERIGMIDGIEDVSMTTNGMLLEQHASSLAGAGLSRLNVSLDSLDSKTFEAITRYGVLDKVWRGVDAAATVGIKPIKLNVLALSWLNESPTDWLRFIREHEFTVRLMELMPIGMQPDEIRRQFVDLTRLRKSWQLEYGLIPDPRAHQGNGPATYWTLPDACGSIGFITPLSEPYCQSCRRLRVSSDGRLYSCLAHGSDARLFEAIRRRDEGAVVAGVAWSVQQKQQGHHWRDGAQTEHTMFSLGG